MPKKPDNEGHENTVIVTEKAVLSKAPSTYEPYLIQISGRQTGQMHNLNGKTVKIGRDAGCQISLDDPHVSRVHAEIVNKENKVVIRDLGSTNGIVINGTRATEHTLMDGDKILIGTRLYFKFCYQDAVDQTYQQNLFKAANIDALTKLYNKKYFIDVFSKEFSFSRRNHQPLSLMLVDIDHFKKINDTHGHVAGDAVLKSMGEFLLKNLRLENIACRFGGEEFAIIVRNATREQAYHVAERLRQDIEATKIVHRTTAIPITVSIGIATIDANQDFETIEDFIEHADRCLYTAKESGRNQTINETQLPKTAADG